MLNKCANPACPREFLSLRNGELFEIETECMSIPSRETEDKARERRRHVEFYWLCDVCSGSFVLRTEGGQVTAAAVERATSAPEGPPIVTRASAEKSAGVTRILIRPSVLVWRDKVGKKRGSEFSDA